jgi:hypothetical protein
MNEQLQQALATIIGKTMQGVDASISFLSAEIPDVIHQLLVFKLAQACVLLVMAIIYLIAWSVFSYKSFKHGWHEGIQMVTVFAGGAVAVTSAISLFINGGVALQIWLAPKIYLIEYAASLAK